MSAADRWLDLRARILTGGALAVIGIAVIFAGGVPFLCLTVVVAAVIMWEITRMIAPGSGALAIALAIGAGAVVALAPVLPPVARLPLAFLPPLAGAFLVPRFKLVFFAFALALEVAAHGLAAFRFENGNLWLIWLILIVVATDIAGYFAGRAIGGPKFWPAVSPKKTWSGTVAGWLVAGLIGALFLTFTEAGRDLIWISMLLSFASQMGDVAESALKRLCGVKDSSSLLPGHGGLYDRFDGLLGASLLMLLTAQLTTIPGLA